MSEMNPSRILSFLDFILFVFTVLFFVSFPHLSKSSRTSMSANLHAFANVTESQCTEALESTLSTHKKSHTMVPNGSRLTLHYWYS